MRPIGAWKHMMSSSALVAAKTGTDGFGKPTYGTAVRYDAHLSRKPEMVLTAQGQQVLSNQSLHLATAAPIQATAQVTLSTGDVGSTEAIYLTPLIYAVERLFDESGAHHTILRLR